MGMIRAQKTRTEDTLIELSGEFDICQADPLAEVVRSVSDAARATGGVVLVDLSEVTFMDTMCLHELAIMHQLYAGRLMLLRPSWQIKIGTAASGLEEWLHFHPTEEFERSGASHLRNLHAEEVTKLTQTPEGDSERLQDLAPGSMSGWSTEKVKAEISRMMEDLERARDSELAARMQATEKTPVSEAVLQTRREEVSRLHHRYVRLHDELEVRNESYP